MISCILVLYFLGCVYSLECTLGSPENLNLHDVIPATPRDIKLRPGSDELWVAFEGNDSLMVLTLDEDNTVVETEEIYDILGYHYVDQISSLAFSADGSWFGTCQESNNTYSDPTAIGNAFMGPSLWYTDDYGQINQDKSLWEKDDDGKCYYGSHYDMLHEAPFCTGIEFWDNKRYFALDGSGYPWFDDGNLVMFDFQQDHGPGGCDHTDGIVWRIEGEYISRVDRVSSHMKIASNAWLYIADTGGNRIVRFQVGSGSVASKVPYKYWPENLQAYNFVTGGVFETVVSGLSHPSAMALVGDNHFIVGSHASGSIKMYDLDGNLVQSWDNFDQSGLQSVLIHNDVIYAVNSIENTITARSFTCDVESEPVGPSELPVGEEYQQGGKHCYKYANKDKCDEKGGNACAWNAETQNCDMLGEVGMCTNILRDACKDLEPLCKWDKITKACFDPPAKPCWYEHKQYCNKAGYCDWVSTDYYNALYYCTEKACTDVIKKGDCGNLGCKWNNKKNRCVEMKN